MVYAKQNRFYSVDNKFFSPVLPYIFNINVEAIPKVYDINLFWDSTDNDPSPRVQAWGENSTSYNFVTSVTSYTEMFNSTAHVSAGVDTFVWSACQDAIITYNGPGTLTVLNNQGPSGDDPLYAQTVYSLSYNIPNIYNVNIEIIPKAQACNQEISISDGGQSFPGITPSVSAYYYNIGTGLGTVRVVGDTNAAPDRFLFGIDDEIVLDTFYRGASTVSYYNQITAAHALPEASGIEMGPIIECSACGDPNDDDPKGRFELLFEKTSTSPFVAVSALMPIGTALNTWSLKIYCPEIVQEPLFGFDINEKTFQGENT